MAQVTSLEGVKQLPPGIPREGTQPGRALGQVCSQEGLHTLLVPRNLANIRLEGLLDGNSARSQNQVMEWMKAGCA